MASNVEELRRCHAEIVRRHGDWTAHTIRLVGDFYTLNDRKRIASNALRLRRFLQLAADLAEKPLDQLRVLDLACLEGMYGIEFALHGAEVVAVEIRDDHIVKARFAAEALGLSRYEVRKDDVRNLSPDQYGNFDVVLCIGILYHLDSPDVFDVIKRMSSVCSRLLIIDTHISNLRGRRLAVDGQNYRGRKIFEHLPWTTAAQRARKPWASIDNPSSVWLSSASLESALQDAGFTSVSDCGVPALLEPRVNRATFAAVKGNPVALRCTPGESAASLPRVMETSMTEMATRHVRSAVGIVRTKLGEWRRRSAKCQ
jgi:2-polyprenyl-3-methyl-5-hydroxy-6-metoxy-1,4-benzoquinol methylase